jgi:hypothetical protein
MGYNAYPDDILDRFGYTALLLPSSIARRRASTRSAPEMALSIRLPAASSRWSLWPTKVTENPAAASR